MAIATELDRKLADLLKIDVSHLTDRVLNWLWVHMSFECHNEPYFRPTVPSPMALDSWIIYFTNQPQSQLHITDRSARLLPDEKLDWIDEGEWQNCFLQNQLFLQTNQVPGWLGEVRAVLHGRNLTIALIDSRSISLVDKQMLIDRLRESWNFQLALDRPFRWFEKDDEREKCKLMWEMTTKTYPTVTNGVARFENLDSMLFFFDQARFTYEQKTFLLDRLKRRWSQNKYRSNLEGKKQVNLVLSERTIELLDKLAKEFNLSKAEVMDTLIRDESQKKMYLPERIAKWKALTGPNE